MGLNYFFNNYDNRYDLIRVVETYWVSYKRIGYLVYRKPESYDLVNEIVTDEILRELINEYGIKQLRTVTLDQHSANPVENTIVWDYVPEVWYGVKILKDNTDLYEDVYIFGEPVEHQLREKALCLTLCYLCVV